VDGDQETKTGQKVRSNVEKAHAFPEHLVNSFSAAHLIK
jgi:hypothetical protein